MKSLWLGQEKITAVLQHHAAAELCGERGGERRDRNDGY